MFAGSGAQGEDVFRGALLCLLHTEYLEQRAVYSSNTVPVTVPDLSWTLGMGFGVALEFMWIWFMVSGSPK